MRTQCATSQKNGNLLVMGPQVLVMGHLVLVMGPLVRAISHLVIALGPQVLAFGHQMMATGPQVIAMGHQMMAMGPQVIAMGPLTPWTLQGFPQVQPDTLQLRHHLIGWEVHGRVCQSLTGLQLLLGI